MSSSETEATPSYSSSCIPCRSQQPLSSTAKSPVQDPDLLSSKTPEKASQPSLRVWNRKGLLSRKEVRRAAERLDESSNPQQPQDRTDGKKYARRKINSWNEESSVKNPTDAPEKLPEKYEILIEFFSSLDSAIRLSRLKGSSSTFADICPKIEILTDRRFSYDHLAQLMFILPEVVEVQKVLVFEERTSCMKPDLLVTICSDVPEKDGKLRTGSGHMHLRKLFCSRLSDFAHSHPECKEVPKAILPEPFNLSSEDLLSKPSSELFVTALANSHAIQGLSILSNDETEELSIDYSIQDPISNMSEDSNLNQTAVASHISPHFCRRFSKKSTNTAVNIRKVSKLYKQCTALANPDPSLTGVSLDVVETSSTAASSVNQSPIEAFNDKCVEICASPVQLPSSCFLQTPGKEASNITNEYNSSIDTTCMHSTPAKLALTPAKLMISTPALAPPVKCSLSPGDDITFSPSKLVRRTSRSRSLKFDTPVKNEWKDGELDESTSVSVDSDFFDILPQSLLQSIREKERKVKEGQDPAISQAKRRQKMISRLPKLLDMIHFLLQSTKRSVITKEELIHKIIVGHSEIVDKREVEEQLSLLLELVPGWISEKAFGSDLLLCINKLSCLKATRSQLEEAN